MVLNMKSEPMILFLLNLAFTIWAGCVATRLALRAEGEGATTVHPHRVVLFLFGQLFLIAIVLGLVFFAICVIDPVKF